jgi:LuxR family maltose regulon positive regulatory protein
MSEIDQWQDALPDDLLRAKIELPRPQASAIARPALLAELTAGLTRKLTLLAAPAGYGKTTLLTEWAASLAHPIAWLTCDAADVSPPRFWRYVIGACSVWGVRADWGALRDDDPQAIEALLTPFMNGVARLNGPRVIVLDDFHTIGDPQVQSQLAAFIERLPRPIHMALSSRTLPELPLARWRGRNELTELGPSELRFSREEIQRFIDQALQRPAPSDAVARLLERTGGWPVGVRLAARSIPARDDAAEANRALESFDGAHPHVVAYMAGEVLAPLPERQRAFILATSPLPALSAALCDAVTGRADSASLIGEIAGASRLLSPAEGPGREWYSYQPLFAEAMREHARQALGDAATRALFVRACDWYEAHGRLPDAVDAALVAPDAARAAALMEHVLERDTLRELPRLRRWVERLPEDLVRSRPLLCFGYATALLFTGDRYDAATGYLVEQWLRPAEASWQAQQNAPQLGRAEALRGMVAFWQNDLPTVFAHARRASAMLDPHDVTFQGICRLYHGIEALLDGQIADAQSLAMEARTLCTISRNQQGTLASIFVLMSTSFQQGNLDLSAALAREWLDSAVGEGAEMLDDQGEALHGLALVAFERSDLEEAERHAARALELGQQRHSERLRVQASLLLARIRHARGQTAQAQQLVQALASQARAPLLREIQTWQAQLALAAGDPGAAQRALALRDKGHAAVSRLQQEHEALVSARLQIALGQPDAASAGLETWRYEAVSSGRTRGEILILTAQAAAYFATGDLERSAQALARALALAQPRGLRQIFLDEGPRLAELLRAVAPSLKRTHAAYAAELLRALGAGPAAGASSARAPLLEPLSVQEQRVLRLLVAGRSNAEVAGDLMVSPNTVKTHVKNIYRKLDVRSRADLREAARELGLLALRR